MGLSLLQTKFGMHYNKWQYLEVKLYGRFMYIE